VQKAFCVEGLSNAPNYFSGLSAFGFMKNSHGPDRTEGSTLPQRDVQRDDFFDTPFFCLLQTQTPALAKAFPYLKVYPTKYMCMCVWSGVSIDNRIRAQHGYALNSLGPGLIVLHNFSCSPHMSSPSLHSDIPAIRISADEFNKQVNKHQCHSIFRGMVVTNTRRHVVL